ncbi:hypothetical protein M2333_002689 [Sphingobium sp. B11D3B]|uniref:hypothetical protein n=1 Tax=Sphingobium sp. B11D3B TaxID=2940575 RepID=UPI0022273B53|nr:hypothetical protein [Sphingobium sp. B11D3B]MCW2389643.1 hypothetical protein [Sphingobium sp. B11D3B]
MSKQTRDRWSLLARSLAGTLGAYGLASLVTAALSLLLSQAGVDPVEAVTAATLLSFAIFAFAAMAAFHARSATRAWMWFLAASIPAGVALLLLLPGLRG